MKRIITLILLLVFTMEPAAFAVTVDSSINTATQLKSIQKSEEPRQIDVFNNNYQDTIKQQKSTTR